MLSGLSMREDILEKDDWVPQVSLLRPGILHANAGSSDFETALGT